MDIQKLVKFYQSELKMNSVFGTRGQYTYPESLSLALEVSPSHCHSRLVKVYRVPVIASRDQ